MSDEASALLGEFSARLEHDDCWTNPRGCHRNTSATWVELRFGSRQTGAPALRCCRGGLGVSGSRQPFGAMPNDRTS
ncbi:hypothetical protein [Streptomyces sp. I05A-00742]|uniref:hypothetical protein n=1 Tax=Streptomyces sp. I05A-00742 TaxID=2732853 RepID=UPI001489811B|nr:hypothetical protein [Streptomyces sp. I05A-00742]